jgi:hypothetical protein
MLQTGFRDSLEVHLISLPWLDGVLAKYDTMSETSGLMTERRQILAAVGGGDLSDLNQHILRSEAAALGFQMLANEDSVGETILPHGTADFWKMGPRSTVK